MLSGLVGLTAMASSDSFRCRWLTSTLTGVAAAILGPARCAAEAVAGTPASVATARTAPATIGNRKRYMIGPSSSPRPPRGYASRSGGFRSAQALRVRHAVARLFDCPDKRIFGTRGSQYLGSLGPPIFDGGPPSALRSRSPFNDDRRERSAGLRGSVE